MRDARNWTLVGAMIVACGGAVAPRSESTVTRALAIDESLASLQYRRTDNWMEVAVPPSGATYTLRVPAHTCAVVVALVSSEAQQVRMELDDHVVLTAPGASWVTACVEEPRTLNLVVFSEPRGHVLVGSYLGTAPAANARLHALLSDAPPPAPPAPLPPAPAASTRAQTSSAPQAATTPAQAATTPTTPTEVEASASRASTSGGEAQTDVLDPFLPSEPSDSPACEAGGDEARAVARRHYRAALRALEDDELEAAGEQMQLAYDCAPDGTILLNLAGIRAQQRKFAVARRLYQQLLTRYPNMPDRRRREVEQALDRLTHGTIRVSARRGDRVYVNGVEVPVHRRRAQTRVTTGRVEVVIVDRNGRRSRVHVEVGPTAVVDVDPRSGSEGS